MYAVIAPVIAIKLQLHELGSEEYTLFKQWDDWQGLDRKILLKTLKLFVHQEEIPRPPKPRYPPKLFILALVPSDAEESAYRGGVNAIRNLIDFLTIFFRTGFRLLEYEIITVNLPLTTVGDIGAIELSIEDGHVKEICSRHEKWTMSIPYFGRADHKEYVTTYFEIPKLESNARIDLEMMPREMLFQIDECFGIFNSLEIDKQLLIKTIARLYSGAITVDDMYTSYLLLWNVVETIASIEDAPKKLINEDTLQEILKVLESRKYAEIEINRVSGILRNLSKKTETQRIVECLKKYLPSNKNLGDAELVIKEYRKLRGKIVHPRPGREASMDELSSVYKKLREIVDALIFELSTKWGLRAKL